jgi:hypothetical protein
VAVAAILDAHWVGRVFVYYANAVVEGRLFHHRNRDVGHQSWRRRRHAAMKGRYCEMCDYWWPNRITKECPACGADTIKGDIPNDLTAEDKKLLPTVKLIMGR